MCYHKRATPPGENAVADVCACVAARLFGFIIYFLFSSLSFAFVFDKKTMEHPKYLKHQVWLEIKQAMTSMPGMALCTAPVFLAEIRGYSKMYDSTADGPGLWYNFAQFPLFLIFTDFFIYLIHRGLHHPLVYKRLHKPHHRWIVPTPYASFAFHPIDGFARACPTTPSPSSSRCRSGPTCCSLHLCSSGPS